MLGSQFFLTQRSQRAQRHRLQKKAEEKLSSGEVRNAEGSGATEPWEMVARKGEFVNHFNSLLDAYSNGGCGFE